MIAPTALIPFLFFFVACNAAGAGGDLIMVIQLMSFSPETLMEDNDVGVMIYGPVRNGNAA
jgi:hypothetical protein